MVGALVKIRPSRPSRLQSLTSSLEFLTALLFPRTVLINRRLAIATKSKTPKKLKYQEIEQQLLTLARSLQPGDRIPSIRNLMVQYDAGMLTIVRALERAEESGLIQRRHGSGIYVCKPPLKPALHGIRSVAVLLPSSASPFISTIISFLSRYLNRGQIHMLLYDLEAHPEHAQKVCAKILGSGAGALIYFPIGRVTEEDFTIYNQRVLEPFIENQWKILLLDMPIPGLDLPYVTSDQVQGATLIAEYLWGLGHRKVAFLESFAAVNNTLRWDTFRSFFEARGETPVFLRYPGVGTYVELIREATDRILSAKPTITAVFAANDLVAAKLVQEVRNQGASVPERISVVGYDDIEYSKSSNPQITTIAQPFEQMARRAAEVLVQAFESPENQITTSVLPVTLIERQSCSVARTPA